MKQNKEDKKKKATPTTIQDRQKRSLELGKKEKARVAANLKKRKADLEAEKKRADERNPYKKKK